MAFHYLKARRQFEKERMFTFDTRLFKHLDSSIPPEIQILLREKYNCSKYTRKIGQIIELRLRTLLLEIDHMLFTFSEIEKTYLQKSNKGCSLFYLHEITELLNDEKFGSQTWELNKNRSYHNEDDFYAQYEEDFLKNGEFSLFKTDKKIDIAEVKRNAMFDRLYSLVIKHKVMAEYEICDFALSKIKEIEQ